MHIVAATEPGDPSSSNEDWVTAAQRLIVVLDGATARTDTGCRHGIAWYSAKLGSAITSLAIDETMQLTDVVSHAIAITAGQHPECDLTHPGTPSAAIGIVRLRTGTIEYLVLGDTTVVIDSWDGVRVVTDDRVDATALDERAEAKRYPFGTPEKQAALLVMKRAELAHRNQPGGFWVAAADPTVTNHAITGSIETGKVQRLAVLTDGAARISAAFGLLDWIGVLELLEDEGPSELIRRVRAIEASDPDGSRWPRNKRSDDATAVFASRG